MEKVDIHNLIARARELAALAKDATPGPWSYGLYFGGAIKLCKKRPNGDTIVADLFSTLDAQQNATLAACAPEMADLLGKLADELEKRLPLVDE